MEQQTITPPQNNSADEKQKKQMQPLWMCVAAIMLTVVLLAALIFVKSAYTTAAADKGINSDAYQVVTLKSGRSYFGKLSDLGKEYARIESTFYLQPKTPEVNESGEVITPEGDDELPFTLQRIGNQVYGPEAEIFIRTDDISNWQNLSGDSPVAKAIDEYLSGKKETEGSENN